jgi:chromosome segregation ATPase
MATIDDVILQKNKEVEALQKKVQAFKDEIAALTEQVRVKRTELSVLVKKTTDNLNDSIVSLNEEVSQKTAKIKVLDSAIKEKSDKLNEDISHYEQHYKNLEDMVKKEYTQRLQEQNAIDVLQKKTVEMLTQQAVDQRNKGNELVATEQHLQSLHNQHEERVKAFNINSASEKSSLTQLSSVLEDGRKKLEQDKKIFADKVLAEERGSTILQREKRASEILARINEAEEILNEAKAKEANLLDKEVKLNQKIIQQVADANRLTAREDALVVIERKLAEREKNINLTEAAYVKKSG